jgi:hypothetical protein
MAVSLTTFDRETLTLTTEEHEILQEGHENWFDYDSFSLEKVQRVKDIFKKVFGLSESTTLMGLTFPDAIVLQPTEDEHVFYAMVTVHIDDGGGWEAMELKSEGIMQWVPTVPFRLVLALLSTSVCGMTVQTQRHADHVDSEAIS